MPVLEIPIPARPASTLSRFRVDPVAFLRQLAARGEPMATFRMGHHTLALVCDPDTIEELLVTKQASFRKGPGLLRARPLLGDGLLTTDGARHRARRRQLQPAFQPATVKAYTNDFVGLAEDATYEWRPGQTRDIHREMMRLTLAVVGRTLFASRREVDAVAVAGGIAEALQALYRPLSRCPHAGGDAAQAAQVLNDALTTLNAGHCPAPGADDLFSLLRTSALTLAEQHDEAMTFLVAGHESVANALTWTWYVLSQHEDVRERFEAEVNQAGSGVPDPSALPYTRQVISESLRLYPPAWMVSREATEDVTLGGRHWSAGTIFIAAPCVTHVDPRFWDDAHRFAPERWAWSAIAKRPRFAYFPFGGGARRCIGDQFALTEMAVILATLGRRWRLDPPPDARKPRWEPLVTLRPAGGLPMTLTRR